MRRGIDHLLARSAGPGRSRPLRREYLDEDMLAMLQQLEAPPPRPQGVAASPPASPPALPAWLPEGELVAPSRARSHGRAAKGSSTAANVRRAPPSHASSPPRADLQLYGVSLPVHRSSPADWPASPSGGGADEGWPTDGRPASFDSRADTSASATAEEEALLARQRFRAAQASAMEDAQQQLRLLEAARFAAASLLRRGLQRWREQLGAWQALQTAAAKHQEHSAARRMFLCWRHRAQMARYADHCRYASLLASAFHRWRDVHAHARWRHLKASWTRWRVAFASHRDAARQAVAVDRRQQLRRSFGAWQRQLSLVQRSRTVSARRARSTLAAAFQCWRRRRHTQAQHEQALTASFRRQACVRKAWVRWRGRAGQQQRAVAVSRRRALTSALQRWRARLAALRAAAQGANACAQRSSMKRSLQQWRLQWRFTILSKQRRAQLLGAAWIVWSAARRHAARVAHLERTRRAAQARRDRTALHRLFVTWRVRYTLRAVRRKRFRHLGRELLRKARHDLCQVSKAREGKTALWAITCPPFFPVAPPHLQLPHPRDKSPTMVRRRMWPRQCAPASAARFYISPWPCGNGTTHVRPTGSTRAAPSTLMERR